MRTIVYAWLGANAAFVGYMMVRGWIEQQQVTAAIRLLRERDHAEALVMERVRNWQVANRRIMKDLGLKVATPKPRVTESDEGVFIRASCEAEAAEILYIRYCTVSREAA